MSFPVEYVPPARYGTLSDDDLLGVLCSLTQDVIDLRSDLANLSVQWNSQFFDTFLECHGESVAGRNRLAEAATLQLTNEKVECEANIAANEDLCSLIRLILEWRKDGRQERVGSSGRRTGWEVEAGGQAPVSIHAVQEAQDR